MAEPQTAHEGSPVVADDVTATAGETSPATVMSQAPGTSPDPSMSLDERDQRLRAKRRRRNLILKVLAFLSIAAGWQVFSLFQPGFTTPSVPVVIEAMWDAVVNDRFLFHIQQTLYRVIIGFALAFVLGVMIGAVMGLSRDIENFFEIHILTALMLPGLAWAIMAFMWLGVSNSAAVLAIILVSVPIVAITVMHGTKAIDNSLTEMADAYGSDRWLKFRQVTMPQLYPYMFGAVRNGFALAWKVVVLSELLGLSNGVGYKVYEQYQLFRFRGVLAWTLLFAIVMFLMEFILFKPVERRLSQWRPETR